MRYYSILSKEMGPQHTMREVIYTEGRLRPQNWAEGVLE